MKGDNFALPPPPVDVVDLHQRKALMFGKPGWPFRSQPATTALQSGAEGRVCSNIPPPPFSIAPPLPFQTITRVVVMKGGALGGHPTPLFPINEKGGGFAILC
nr:hypothetical protein [Morchella crassipes]